MVETFEGDDDDDAEYYMINSSDDMSDKEGGADEEVDKIMFQDEELVSKVEVKASVFASILNVI